MKRGCCCGLANQIQGYCPWYDYVEEYIGISGEKLGLPQLPDGKFLKPMEMHCVEKDLKKALHENYNDRTLTIGRVAHITEGTKKGLGRFPASTEIDVEEVVHLDLI